jgi:hypothetical protein
MKVPSKMLIEKEEVTDPEMVKQPEEDIKVKKRVQAVV